MISEVMADDWMKIAESEVGVSEDLSDKSNPKVLEYHEAASGLDDDAYAWCSAFVNWVMMKAGYRRTKNAMARSWLNFGEKLECPRYGCIVVMSRGANKIYGHVGFVVKHNLLMIKVLGGNQDDKVCYKWYPRVRVIGYRWPSLSDKLENHSA